MEDEVKQLKQAYNSIELIIEIINSKSFVKIDSSKKPIKKIFKSSRLKTNDGKGDMSSLYNSLNSTQKAVVDEIGDAFNSWKEKINEQVFESTTGEKSPKKKQQIIAMPPAPPKKKS